MRNKTFRKMLAGMLATTMVLGMSTIASAQTGDATGTGTTTGTGTFEGHVDKDVVSVTLPTSAATTFAYKMDPEGLIAATESAKYSGATFESGANVYFQSAENTWTKESAKLKVVNKGTVAVDVTVVAKTAENDKVAMADSATFADTDKAAKLYLGLKVANQPEVAVKTDETGKVVVGLSGNDENYTVTSGAEGYVYAVKAGVPDTAWNSFEFSLTGACNPKGDYSAADLAASNVTVTWSYAVRADDSSATLLAANATSEAAPSITTKAYTFTKGTDLDVTVSLGSGDLAASKVAKVQSGKTADGTFSDMSTATISGNKVTIAGTNYGSTAAGDKRYIKVIFDDTAKTEVVLELTVAEE